jgi:hypothetical protein
MRLLGALVLPVLFAGTITALAQADAPSDAQVLEGAQTQASLGCPDYTAERGNPGIAVVPVAALRTLARHHFLLCPDSRIKGEMAVIWYPKVGVFAWSPGDPAVLKTLAEIVDRVARLDDFPESVTVWDAADEELGSQGAPDFKLKDGYTRPE